MKFPIGFNAVAYKEGTHAQPDTSQTIRKTPKKSVVQVHFPARDITLAYYNNAFDLRIGDTVYVDGKLEGLRGRVANINYTFKIKLSDYKRVIGVADTDIKGRLYLSGAHFVTFDPLVLPFRKISTWFAAPQNNEEYISCYDGSSFNIKELSGIKIQSQTADRGYNYYIENKVAYVSIDGSHGYAIVEGSKPYTIEFDYDSGKISNLICNCFCGNICKHEFAAMLQLRETLEFIGKNYATKYSKTGYIAAVSKTVLFTFVIDGNDTGTFLFE